MLTGFGGEKLDKAGQFLWTALSEVFTYSANRIPEISDNVVEIDRAHAHGLQLGDGTIRALGCDRRPSLGGAHEAGGQAGRGQRGEAARLGPQELVHGRSATLPVAGPTSIFATTSVKEEKVAPGVWSVTVAKKSNGVVKANSGASLIDLGDGVGCIEFHSKMNSLGADIIQLTSQVLKPGGPGDEL